MLRETTRRSTVLAWVLMLLTASVIDTRAESESNGKVTSIRESASRISLASVSMASQWPPSRRPCSVKRRALVGAAIGSVVAMVTVRKAAEANDGNAGAKVTAQAAGYGGALGAFIGLTTCR